MKRGTILFTLIACLIGLPAAGQDAVLDDPDEPSFGQNIARERRGQTGFKFLSVSPDTRAAGMSDAYTSQLASSTAMFFNPATMAYMPHNTHIAIGQVQWIADVTYNAASAAFMTRIGVFGVSMVAVDYGDFEETIRSDSDQGYTDLGKYSPTGFALGVGYSRAISDRFSVGGNVKFAKQDLGNSAIGLTGTSPIRKSFSESTMIVDFGVFYSTGFKSLNFALASRNFSRENTYSEESFELPLTFRMGLSMDLMDFSEIDKKQHSLMVSLDTERPRDFSELIKIGAEYTLKQTISLRGGYVFPTDEQGISLGFGVQHKVGKANINVDYAYTDFGVFDNVNRFGIGLAF